MTTEDETQTTSSTGASTRNGRSRRSGRRRHGEKKRTLLLIAVSTLAFLLLMGNVLSLSRITRLEQINEQLSTEVFEKAQELSQLKPRFEKIQGDLDDLVEGRLPDLIKLGFDKVHLINRSYIKSAVLTETQKNGIKTYEYLLVLENNSSNDIRPRLAIQLFSGLGVQVGSSQVVDHKALTAGESRTYASKVALFMDQEPQYFFISELQEE